jgi:DNA-binding transcriptional LysR family regulator
LHFGQAAARQHVTQSALSKQIRRLEADLGGELFERNAGSTRLTVLGRALYADACTLVAQSEQLARSARDVLAGHAGTLRIGFGVATKLLVPAAIARFRASRPGVAIELNDLSTHHQLLALAEGRLDLGFCRLPAPKGWPVLPVVRAHFVAVLPAGYQGVAGLADLQEKPLAILRRDKAPSFTISSCTIWPRAGCAFRTSSTSTTSPPASPPRRPASPGPWSPPPPPLSIPMC